MKGMCVVVWPLGTRILGTSSRTQAPGVCRVLWIGARHRWHWVCTGGRTLWDAEAVNGALMAGEDGFRKVEIISDRFSMAVEIERSPSSSDVFGLDDLLGGGNGDDFAMDCF